MSGSIKNQRSRRLVRLLLAVVAACLVESRAAQELPVFLADNHAETFGWITRTLDLDEPHVLVLVDAHSDASAAERSEELREMLRRVPSEAERALRVDSWREQGRVQAFNWIEPLMPRPLDEVRWLASERLTGEEREGLTREAAEQLDGRLEVEPRSAGPFGGRWVTSGLQELLDWEPGMRPVVLAIDLDFFVGMEAAKRDELFEALWERAMDWPALRGVAFAVSRPWLTDDREADELVRMAVSAVRRTRGAWLELDASPDDRPDQSLMAEELAGTEVPRWDLASASGALQAELGLLGQRLLILDRLRTHERDRPVARILPHSGEQDCDGVWRFAAGEVPVLRVEAPAGATGNVRWHALETAREAYDLLPETGLGKAFSESPGRWIYERRRSLGGSRDFMLHPDRWSRGGGRVRISAEFESDEGWLPTETIELRIRNGHGFRGAISECFGMPYVFGIAGVFENDLSAVESGWGSDCGNLLVHAWRRNGLRMDWGDPGMLRRQLATKAEDVRVQDHVEISTAEVERGLLVDFGKHVAAVWEDREPVGVLDGGDLVVHHLGGVPELVALAQLAEERPVFSLRVPREGEPIHVALAGDVVLAGHERVVVEGFSRGDADVFIANLEGIPSLHEPDAQRRYDFRFPAEKLAWLRGQGVDAVSLANNHALDAGAAGLLDGVEALSNAGIASFGAGRNEEEACQPWRTGRRGVKLAVFGISLLEVDEAGESSPGVASLPRHRQRIEREMMIARSTNERIIVMLHGGDEYQSKVNSSQREWCRWLVARGASVIAGAHPHVIQREETHGGARIFHSLGNAVYPRELSGAASGEVRSVEAR